jgi:hypothetical protein
MKPRTNVVGILPNDAAIVWLVGSQLLEQQEEWQLKRSSSSLDLRLTPRSLSCQFSDQGP